MKVLLGALLLASSLLFSQKVSSNEPEHKVHVIFAIDHSASMFDYGNPRWNIAVRLAFAEYFENYLQRCEYVTVTYVAWGETIDKPFGTELKSIHDAVNFSRAVAGQSYSNKTNTNPYIGIHAAIQLVKPGYDRTIILVISEADGIFEDRVVGFKEELPPDVEFIGIALDTETSVEFFNEYLIPARGQVIPSRTKDELIDTFKQVMDGIGYDYCKVS